MRIIRGGRRLLKLPPNRALNSRGRGRGEKNRSTTRISSKDAVNLAVMYDETDEESSRLGADAPTRYLAEMHTRRINRRRTRERERERECVYDCSRKNTKVFFFFHRFHQTRFIIISVYFSRINRESSVRLNPTCN